MAKNACSVRVKVSGSLGPYIHGLQHHLLELGYAPASATHLLQVAAHLSRWLERRSLDLSAVTSSRLAQFVRSRRRSGYTHFVATRSLEPILAFLSSAGALAGPVVAQIPQGPVGVLLGGYLDYLERERGLAAATIASREQFTTVFLTCHPKVEGLTAADVTAFFLRESKRYSVGSAKILASALRSLLRYLHVSGKIPVDLGGALPAVAGWRLAGLPKALAPGAADDVLRSCDRRTVVGKRDFAILSLLARLGLRAGEVRTLTLDDLHWAEGVIVVHGKGSTVSDLPLPVDVGRSLVAYLRVRGNPPARLLFLQVRAPIRGLSRTSIGQVVRRASMRAGLGPVSPHRLRHTVATEMLRRGGSLSEIAHALRHRHVDTTAIYAKVDTTRLQTLARSWPGRAA